MSELDAFRASKDEFFATHPHSPLTPEQKRYFKGLDYFPENPALRLDVQVDEDPEKKPVVMQTSTGDAQEYVRYGTFMFNVDGQTARLAIYASPHGFFLPFVDGLAGTETYSAGRYLDPERLPNGRFLVDFNLAYNPYCAYNPNWACPIPPKENRLSVRIEAGEKKYDSSDH